MGAISCPKPAVDHFRKNSRMKKKKVAWPIVVRTRRLEIRPYRLGDYGTWLKAGIGRKKKQNKYDYGPRPARYSNKAHFRKLCARHNRIARKDQCYPFGIFDRKTGAFLGVVDVSTITRDWYQWASVGYQINNTSWGRGYGKEAVRAAIGIAFKQLGYKRVEASIRPDNWRSIRLAKSLGMKREGRRNEYIFDNGEWEDHVIFTIVNPRRAKRSYPML